MSSTTHTGSAGAEVLAVDFAARIMRVVAAPYNQYAVVPYRGGVWRELFEAGAFDGVDADPEKVRVNREHNKADAVGKVVNFNPHDPRGLVADIRIAPTPRGDDTLILASEGMLSASVGFGVHRNGELLDHGQRIRRVTRAWLDHIALVQTPAYDTADVLSVRATPNLDAFRHDPVMAWAKLRSDPAVTWARRRLSGRR